jgi:DNA-binding MarR family transcriptional regulator
MRQSAASDEARQFGELFPGVYLRFHRRDGKRHELPGASRAVLHHLTLTGPLTIGEMAKHLSRAQSVVSEIVDHLERDGLLERMRDPKDRRRTLLALLASGASCSRSKSASSAWSRGKRAARPTRVVKH